MQRFLKVSAATTLQIVFAAMVAWAQHPGADEVHASSQPYTPQTSVVRVETQLVEVGVVVRNNKGRAVGGLQKADFQVFDRGKPQTISFFSVETAEIPASGGIASLSQVAPGKSGQPGSAPPTAPANRAAPAQYVALFFDDNSMTMADLDFARSAAEKLIQTSLDPNDQIAIFTSSLSETVDFTGHKEQLLVALKKPWPHTKMAPEPEPESCAQVVGPYLAYMINTDKAKQSAPLLVAMRREGVCGKCMDENSCYAVATSDAQLVQAMAEDYSRNTLMVLGKAIQYLGNKPGRRILIVASPGFLTATLRSQEDRIIDEALHAGVVIHSLNPEGLAAQPVGTMLDEQVSLAQRTGLDEPLATLADSTGGTFFHNNNDLTEGLRQMAAVPEIRYVLAFSPADAELEGRFHPLRVKLTNDGHFELQARKGYFEPPKPAEPPKLTEEQILSGEVLGSAFSNKVPATMNVGTSRDSEGKAILSVSVHVDTSGLPFQKYDDRSVEHLVFISALFDRSGKFISGELGLVDLALKDSTREEFSKSGLNAGLNLSAAPGDYRLREVIQETAGGLITTIDRIVEIH